MLPFGVRLRILLALNSIHQADLAERAGMDKAQVSRILSGENVPRWKTRRKLIEAVFQDDLSPVAHTP
jgi:transcriptional regulator with XRE-family HTH domain